MLLVSTGRPVFVFSWAGKAAASRAPRQTDKSNRRYCLFVIQGKKGRESVCIPVFSGVYRGNKNYVVRYK